MTLINFDGLPSADAAFSSLSALYAGRNAEILRLKAFTNGGPIMCEDEATRWGVDANANLLTVWSDMNIRVSRMTSTFLSTQSFAHVGLNAPGDPDADVAGEKITVEFNKYVVSNQVIASLVKQLAGELQHAGAVAVTWRTPWAVTPEISTTLMFPWNHSRNPGACPYAFDSKMWAISDLRKFMNDSKGTGNVKTKNIEDLLAKHESFEGEKELVRVVTLYEQDSRGRVDMHMFASKSNWVDEATLIFSKKRVYDSMTDWIVVVDSSARIGEDGTWGEAQGIAAITEPSAVLAEMMLQAQVTGETARSKPRFKPREGSTLADLDGWDPIGDMVAPAAAENFVLAGSTSSLNGPLAQLSANRSGIAGSGVGRPGELRVQALERGSNTSVSASVDIAQWYLAWDDILKKMMQRVALGKCPGFDPLYQGVAQFRDSIKGLVEESIFDKNSFGEMKWLTVRASRLGGDGSAEQLVDRSDWLLKNIQLFHPSRRPSVIRKAVAVRTGDPRLAEALTDAPARIEYDQRRIAGFELTTIFHHALAGVTVPTYPSDVDDHHFEEHLIQVQSMVVTGQQFPWGPREVAQFVKLVEHTALHLPGTTSPRQNNERLSNLVNSANPLIAQAQQQSQASSGLTEKEQAEIMLKQQELGLKAQELGRKSANDLKLQENRDRRAKIAEAKAAESFAPEPAPVVAPFEPDQIDVGDPFDIL